MNYMGGKKRIGEQIADIIIDRTKDISEIKGYIEPFVGMCSIIKHINTKTNHLCIGNDGCKDIIMLFKELQNDEFVLPRTISKEEFELLKYEEPSALRAVYGSGLSYSGRWFSSYVGDDKQRNYYNAVKNNLERIKPMIKGIDFGHHDYSHTTEIVKDGKYIIYCDPPYFKTCNKFGSEYPFNYKEFWKDVIKWVRMGNYVFVSEKEIPEDIDIDIDIDAEILQSFELVSNMSRNRGYYTDKLFYIRGLKEETGHEGPEGPE